VTLAVNSKVHLLVVFSPLSVNVKGRPVEERSIMPAEALQPVSRSRWEAMESLSHPAITIGWLEFSPRPHHGFSRVGSKFLSLETSYTSEIRNTEITF